MGEISIGTAGWSIPRADAERFPAEGTSLERYASIFPVAEINSSFHRPHRRSTWQRWRDSVPDHFRFSAKVPKLITHQRKLVDCAAPLAEFLEEVSALGDRLSVLLVQLPPKLAFDECSARTFFRELKARTPTAIACEPRHPSWFEPAADDLLVDLEVARVAADPAICDGAGRPGGARSISYWRLHGSPVIYRSSYGDRIGSYAALLKAEAAAAGQIWCIFDNTASSAGAGDALALMGELGQLGEQERNGSAPHRS